MRKTLILAALLAGVAGIAGSEDQGLFKEVEKGRVAFDGIAAKKAAPAGAVDASNGTLGSISAGAKALKQARSKAEPRTQLPPRLTGSSPLPHSNKPAEGPRKHIFAFILGVILGAVLVRRVVEVQYSGGGGNTGD